jgi:hypothetical protein
MVMTFPRALVLIASCTTLVVSLAGCKRIVTYAVERALGDDGGAVASSGTGVAPCKLITDAEVEAASGRKVLKSDGTDDTCTWTLGGGSGVKAEDGSSGSVALQIAPELAMKMVPVLGEQKAIPGLGDHAEWSGGMAPNLRVHKGGKVLNFLLVDPTLMMKNPGITEKPAGGTKSLGKGTTGGDTLVNMEYPELEKEAIALAKAALSRY